MMDGSWNLSGYSSTYKQYDDGWKGSQTPGPSSYKYQNLDPYAQGSTRVDATLRGNLESADNPWHTTDSYYSRSSPMKGKQISNPKHDREIRIKPQITGQESHGGEIHQRVV